MKITTYKVEIKFLEPILGTVPKDQSIYDTYIKIRAKGKETKDEFASPLTHEETTLKEARGWTGFHEEKKKPYLFDYQIKGFLKDTANILKNSEDMTAAKSKVENYVFLSPRKIFIKGKRLKNPIERPLRAMTMQGPRVTLVRSDAMAENSKIEFELKILDGPISLTYLKKILDFGKLRGLGQARNMGYGRFEYKLNESQ